MRLLCPFEPLSVQVSNWRAGVDVTTVTKSLKVFKLEQVGIISLAT